MVLKWGARLRCAGASDVGFEEEPLHRRRDPAMRNVLERHMERVEALLVRRIVAGSEAPVL